MIELLVSAVFAAVLLRVKLAGVLTVVEALAQLLVPQPEPGVGGALPPVASTEA